MMMDDWPGVSAPGDAACKTGKQEKGREEVLVRRPSSADDNGQQITYRKSAGETSECATECEFVGFSKVKEHIPLSAQKAIEEMGDFVHAMWDVVSHHSLPDWLKDNDYLLSGHRPQLNSYWACIKSIFRIHTETGNIWTHLLGCVAFVLTAVYLLLNPHIEMQLYDQVVFLIYFTGATLCLSFSWLFHTFCCHSPSVGRLFSKLDYCGISAMVMASFLPWLYYGFYCDLFTKIIYMSGCMILGSACIVVSLFDRFADASYRSTRAGLFIVFGLFGVVPAVHYTASEGFYRAIYVGSLGWLGLMAVLYIGGAVIYALRFPERYWPGKFDLWGQSHQIFHICVVLAAFVHCYGITSIAKNIVHPNACGAST